jgi:hypothetical protein
MGTPAGPFGEAGRLLTNLGILIVVWALLLLLAINVLHVPFAVLVTLGVVITVVAVAFDVVRWRRRRRP